MRERSAEELLVDLRGVDPKWVEAFISLVKAQSAEAGVVAKVATFSELWEPYKAWGEANLGGWKTVQGIHGPLHLLPYWGDKPWTECGYTAGDEYVSTRRTERVRRKNGKPGEESDKVVAPATINREMATVKAMFNWCLRRPELGVKHNPLARYPTLPESAERKFHLTEEQFVKLLEHSPPLLRLMLIFAFETGMRRDEFRLLQWHEIDLTIGIVRLAAERTKARHARDVPLSDLAIQILERVRCPGSTWVFPSPTSAKPKPVPKSTFGQQFAKARKDAGVTGPRGQAVWVHTIRKTSVTEKLLAGMDLQMNMDMHGHTSKEVHDEYRILTPAYMQATREALNRRRGPKAVVAPPAARPQAETTGPEAADESPLLRFVSATTNQ